MQVCTYIYVYTTAKLTHHTSTIVVYLFVTVKYFIIEFPLSVIFQTLIKRQTFQDKYLKNFTLNSGKMFGFQRPLIYIFPSSFLENKNSN